MTYVSSHEDSVRRHCDRGNSQVHRSRSISLFSKSLEDLRGLLTKRQHFGFRIDAQQLVKHAVATNDLIGAPRFLDVIVHAHQLLMQADHGNRDVRRSEAGEPGRDLSTSLASRSLDQAQMIGVEKVSQPEALSLWSVSRNFRPFSMTLSNSGSDSNMPAIRFSQSGSGWPLFDSS